MWSSSRSCVDHARSALLGLMAALALVLPPTSGHASNTPLPEGALSGEATLRFLGLQVYRARLWTPPTFDPSRLGEQALALELEYLRAFKGAAIAERSIVEMRRAGRFTDEQATTWQAAMQNLFPDVRPGDRITGLLHPGKGAEFFYNDRPAGRIDDAEFARLFFSIWLGPNTSEPALRRQLLARWLDTPR
ncbi:chalcone isomerase family protein [Tepidicella baoligensis]|uniref:chalcone isomerase family protein n=1 Tax=Tepidicella baoligensis TaxID=2707016 RepID=UPI001FECA53E|nr:chalcone isomerase family protein [Tepidicella baoligensis]